MKKFKKTCAVLLTVIMLISLLALSAFALNDDTVAILHRADGSETEYTSINTALSRAVNGSTVYLVKCASLTASTSVKNGVTLVIPTSLNYTDDSNTEGGANAGNSNAPAGTPYSILTIPAGMELTIDGTLIVAGNQQGSWPRSGFLTGNYGAVNLLGTLTVNGTLYARGEIYGSGEVVAKNGSRVYERFEMADWRGGTASRAAYRLEIFPFSLYNLGGISSKTTFEYGSFLTGQSFIYVLSSNLTVEIPYIRSTGSSNGYIVNTTVGSNIVFTTSNNVTTITVNGGTLETGDLSFSALGYSFDSSGLACPFGYKTNVVINNGSTLNVNTKLKIIPGCSITVNDGGTINIKSDGAMYFYTGSAYKSNFNWANWSTTANATLTNHGTVVVTGELGSSAQGLTNIPGFTATGGTYTMTEYIQSSSSTDTVTFYLAK